MSENSILISKIVKLIIRLHEKKLLCSFLISLVISVIFSVVYGFHFSLYSNDDYNISLLISNGDYNTFYVNSFLSYILVVLQTHFKTINCFVCFQYLGCFASMIALNYVFLQKLSGFIGFLVSVSISSLIFVTDILLVQYSQTAVTLCVAGVALCYAACSLERRKSIRLWQLVSSVFLIVISSLIRIEPFLVSMAFSVLFIICLIFHRFTKTKNNLKDKIFSAVKIHLSLILFVLLSSCLSLGIYWLSGLVLPTDNIARDYNAARTAVVDYRILPYEGNESFYSEVGINSSIELSKIGFDKERYNTQALNRIAEYSQKVLYGGETRIVFAARNTFDRLINSVKKLYYKFIRIKNTFEIKVSNRLSVAIVLFLFLLFGLIAFLVTRGLFRKSNVRINRRRLFLNLIIVLIWTAFFFVMKIDKNNYLFVVLFAIVLITMINKSDNYFSTFVFSLAPILLYLYQINFRMSLRVAYTFLFPSIVFLLFLVSETKNNALIPSRERRYRKGLCVLSSILIIASFGIACAWVCCNYYPGLSEEYNLQLRTYMESYPDTVFVCDIHSNSLVDKGYHNAALKPDIPKNEIVTAGWIMITDYYSNTLLKNDMTDVLADSVDSNSRIVLTEHKKGYLNKAKKNYEDYYNIHYFNGENVISLEQEKIFIYDNSAQIKRIGIYKIKKQR